MGKQLVKRKNYKREIRKLVLDGKSNRADGLFDNQTRSAKVQEMCKAGYKGDK